VSARPRAHYDWLPSMNKVWTIGPKSAQVARFVLSGGVVAACSFLTMTVLVVWLELSAQVALALAYLTALAVHFTLNRQFVFAADSGYALHLSAQGIRYLIVAACSYATTAAAVGFLPERLETSPLIVFYGATAVLAVISFVVLRSWVFHGRGAVHPVAVRYGRSSNGT
jgi:putative flippase GtrA